MPSPTASHAAASAVHHASAASKAGSASSAGMTSRSGSAATSAAASKAPGATASPPTPSAAGTSHPTIGLNLRVTGYCNQGGRKYMEDVFSVAYQQTEDEKDLEYAFFGIFDGHGGREAAIFAKEHLMDFCVRQKNFWSDDDESVLRAIHEGFIQTHHAMWKELEHWPKTASGLPSTAGTTASIAFIRRGKIFVGHVGDSAIVLGAQVSEDPSEPWHCEPLTRDHKPESVEESARIAQSGGKVICKSGVPRVVWNRPRMGHKGPVRRSTHIDEIPFLAVARSLGDLWSYNSEEDVFVVSPEPDTYVYPIDITKHRCLILATDGAWNMLMPQQAVRIVWEAEKSNEQHMLNPSPDRQWINPSKRLVDKAIERWNGSNLRADNTSVVTVMLDPPGPPRAQVLKRQRELALLNNGRSPPGLDGRMVAADRGSVALVTNTTPEEAEPSSSSLPMASAAVLHSLHHPQHHHPHRALPLPPTSQVLPSQVSSSAVKEGISVISRFPNSKNHAEVQGFNLAETSRNSNLVCAPPAHPSQGAAFGDAQPAERSRRRVHQTPTAAPMATAHHTSEGHVTRLSSATSMSAADSSTGRHCPTPPSSASPHDDIQCNEVSSSDDDTPSKTSASSASAGIVTRERRHRHALKASSRLSRELSALRLSSSPLAKPRSARKAKVRADRFASCGESSDTENQQRSLRSSGLGSPRARGSAFADVEMQCMKLNDKIKSIERKVARKTQELNHEVRLLQSSLKQSVAFKPSAVDLNVLRSPQLRSLRSQDRQPSARTPLTPSTSVSASPRARLLRTRTPPSSPSPRKTAASPGLKGDQPLSARKRKRSDLPSAAASSPAKSPKTVHNSRPMVTRARTAKVLHLRR